MEKFEDIERTMESLPGDEDRLEYLLELGGKLPPIPAGGKGDEIRGCSSRLEILRRGSDFFAAADSRMVAGLAYIALSIAGGKTPEEIRNTDFMAKISSLNLPIGQSRVVGLKSMEAFIKK
ncbi:MAG: SufE family protein [Rickettsiales bacterium]|jgi:cysteine desulfuration protein SufE|nr:SufE family protein [Rickettsiales bacterium]